MSEMLFMLKRLRFALRLGWQSAVLGWRIAGGIHAEAQRIRQGLYVADDALYDEVLVEAGTGLLRRTFDE